MRIGLLVAGFPPDRIGGAELQSRQLAEHLALSGHDVTVFTRKLAPNRKICESTSGFQIIRRRVLPVPGLRLLWDTAVATVQVILRRPRLDVLLCYQTINSGLIGILSKSISGIPAVISIRGNEEYVVHSSALKRTVVRQAYRRASLVAVQTPLIKDELLRSLQPWVEESELAKLDNKLHVVPNGICIPSEEPSSGRNVLYIGRLIENKGVADLIIATRNLGSFKTIVVGDGPDRSRLEEIAGGQNVEFSGFVDFDEIPEYLRDARMLVLPSHLGDGLPNVILEAMAYGVPVISTRTAGIPDIIDDGVTGLLIEPGDTEMLRGLVDRLMSDEDVHARIRNNALEFVKQYAWSNVAPRVAAMLADAASLD